MKIFSPLSTTTLHHKFAPLLGPREECIWVGQPWQGIRFYQEDWFFTPYLFVAGIMMLPLGVAFLAAPLLQTQIIGFSFTLMSLYATGGRLWLDAYLRSTTYYALTNRRLMIHFDGLGFRTISFDLQTLTNLWVETHSDKSGTIYLGDLSIGFPFGTAAPAPRGIIDWSNSIKPPPAFEMIPNAQDVYDLIVTTRD